MAGGCGAFRFPAFRGTGRKVLESSGKRCQLWEFSRLCRYKFHRDTVLTGVVIARAFHTPPRKAGKQESGKRHRLTARVVTKQSAVSVMTQRRDYIDTAKPFMISGPRQYGGHSRLLLK